MDLTKPFSTFTLAIALAGGSVAFFPRSADAAIKPKGDSVVKPGPVKPGPMLPKDRREPPDHPFLKPCPKGKICLH